MSSSLSAKIRTFDSSTDDVQDLLQDVGHALVHQKISIPQVVRALLANPIKATWWRGRIVKFCAQPITIHALAILWLRPDWQNKEKLDATKLRRFGVMLQRLGYDLSQSSKDLLLFREVCIDLFLSDRDANLIVRGWDAREKKYLNATAA